MLLTFFINLPQEMKLVLLFLLGGLILIKLYEIFMNSRLKMRFIHEKGVLNQKELIGDELLAVKDYFEKSQYTGFVIDDITSHDLDIDSLFNLMNNTQTNIGQEVLYAKLRRPLFDINKLNQFNALIQSYQSNDQVRGESQYLLFKIPFLSKYQSFYSNFLRLKNLKSNKIHLISLLGLIIGILLLFVSFDIGVPIIGAALVINPMTYLYFSNQTSLQVKASQVITSSLSQLEKLLKINPEATTYLKKDAQEVLKMLSPLKRGSWIADEAPGSILPLKSILFYLTHINYVYFYHMLDKLQKHPEQVEKLMEIIGEIECAICVANLRVSEITTNIPILNETEFCSFTDLIHPLVENCVPNSLSIEQPILITGSNASGKSTFLKAVALNLICAQSLMTTFSQSFK